MDETQLANELIGQLVGLAKKCERVMSPPAVLTAVFGAAIAYALENGLTEARIGARLRELADDLESGAPPAPLVS